MTGEAIEAVGTIKIEIEFRRVTGLTHFNQTPTPKPDVSLSERAKKGGGHCVTLGNEGKASPCALSIRWTTIELPRLSEVRKTSFSSSVKERDMPMYTFVFRHASRGTHPVENARPQTNENADWLQAKEIIAPPVPKPELEVESNPPVAGPSRPGKRKKAVKREAGAPQVIDLLSDSDWLEDEADRVAMRKLKVILHSLPLVHQTNPLLGESGCSEASQAPSQAWTSRGFHTQGARHRHQRLNLQTST
jgi:hypothetical protein